MSPSARELMGSDVHNRYPNYDDTRYYFGNRYMERVEEIAHDLIGRLFRADGVELHVPSGSMASQASILAYASPNDLILELEGRNGGFSALPRLQTCGLIKLRAGALPFDPEEMSIDVTKAVQLIEKRKPAMVILGAGTFLFPHPVRELSKVCRQAGTTKVVYDGAHVLGLIAGRRFQDPLREGADLIVGSTHKTFPGPQNGIILSGSSEGFERLRDVIHNGLVSNHHPHAIAGIAVVAAEMLAYGEAYAAQIVENSKTLARALDQRGMNVLCPQKDYTQSHLVVADVRANGGSDLAGKILEEAGIVVTKIPLPWDRDKLTGLRIGTQEVTRLGMQRDEMEIVAEFFERALLKKENPKTVFRDISRFRTDFQKLHYSFDELDEAYHYFEMSRAMH
jgi:glycine hydroxymethyltransferase